MQNDGTKRLEKALELLNYQEAKEPYHKTELLHAIRIHAGLIGDKELELACQAEIERIRAEFITNNNTLKIDLNVGYCQRNSGSNVERGMIQVNIGHNQRNCMGDFYE